LAHPPSLLLLTHTLTIMNLVYLNGHYLAADEACVSVFDRGFIFGDGVYEVVPVFGGRLFRLPQHLARLERSLSGIRLANPHTVDEWKAIFNRLVENNGAKDQYIYLQITRGAAPRDHAFPVNTTPTVFAHSKELIYPEAGLLATGISAITAQDIRWQRCDIKSIALLANALLRQQAVEQDAAEAILLRDGCVTEGAASNIFVVADNRLITPPRGPYILPGITRDLVLELARLHTIDCAEETLVEARLSSAEEIWMTSSTREILPITRLNNQPVGSGKPGKNFVRMLNHYKEYKKAFRRGEVD
jgi:D-alanine transaminase